MKKMIKASKYNNDMAKNLKWLGEISQTLADVCKANDDTAVQEAVSRLGGWYKNLNKQSDAVKALVENLDYVASDYLLSFNADKRVPEVRKTIIDYLKGLGYPMTKMKTPPVGADESYVIIPADECDFQDLKTVASAIANDFGIKPDTGVIGGSWTSYQFKMDGVAFRIGFELDKDFDPSGKESSLQFYM